MKTGILILITLLVPYSICLAQEEVKNNNFELVKETFSKLYPGAVIKEWELEENNIYEVEFTFNNKRHEADFSHEGKWIYTEKDINLNEVPVTILNSFKLSEWSSWRIDKVEEISTPEHEQFYELKIKREEQKHFLYYLPGGNVLESTSKSKF